MLDLGFCAFGSLNSKMRSTGIYSNIGTNLAVPVALPASQKQDWQRLRYINLSERQKNSFLNIAIRVSFYSSDEWTAFISTYFERIKRAVKSVEENRSIYDLSFGVYPWFKALARFRSIFLAAKSLC